MKVLVIGNGGREHAVANAFAASPGVDRVIVSPGNGGIALSFETVGLTGHTDILRYCQAEGIDLVFIGPEQPIAEGLSDLLKSAGVAAIGASQAAGRIETSKSFAKQLMQKYKIPTAKFQIAESYDRALQVITEFGYPLVIKADGLAAGKGVYIVEDPAHAKEVLTEIFVSKSLGAAGDRVIIEEFLQGWEVSLFVFTDGYNYQCTVFSQDHKQLLDGDHGPNTGGMGAYAPVPEAEPYRQQIEESIVKPVLSAMRAEGCPFEGILYCGLMITSQGAKVVEFNCRLGDPEAQVVLPLLQTDLLKVCQAILDQRVDELELIWDDGYCVCVVLASQGYPSRYEKSIEVFVKDDLQSQVIYAGVRKDVDSLVTSGGRVLNLVTTGDSIRIAREAVYGDIGTKVHFKGMIFRRDIGMRTNTVNHTRTR